MNRPSATRSCPWAGVAEASEELVVAEEHPFGMAAAAEPAEMLGSVGLDSP
jgi:hypothetical protein